MRYLFFFFALLPAALAAQDCHIKKEVDQFTQQMRLTTGFLPLTNGRLSITADNKDIDFLFAVSADKCFDDASTLSVLFEDGRTKSLFRSSGSMNCEGLFHFTLRNTPTSNSNLQRLETKGIKTLVFTNGKVITSLEPTEEQKQKLKAMIACLSTEAKILLAKP